MIPLLTVTTGSRMYGYNDENSDTDRLTLCLESIIPMVLGEKTVTVQRKEGSDDTKKMLLTEFARKCYDGNPDTIAILHDIVLRQQYRNDLMQINSHDSLGDDQNDMLHDQLFDFLDSLFKSCGTINREIPISHARFLTRQYTGDTKYVATVRRRAFIRHFVEEMDKKLCNIETGRHVKFGPVAESDEVTKIIEKYPEFISRKLANNGDKFLEVAGDKLMYHCPARVVKEFIDNLKIKHRSAMDGEDGFFSSAATVARDLVVTSINLEPGPFIRLPLLKDICNDIRLVKDGKLGYDDTVTRINEIVDVLSYTSPGVPYVWKPKLTPEHFRDWLGEYMLAFLKIIIY